MFIKKIIRHFRGQACVKEDSAARLAVSVSSAQLPATFPRRKQYAATSARMFRRRRVNAGNKDLF
jgi:hypothetical protein